MDRKLNLQRVEGRRVALLLATLITMASAAIVVLLTAIWTPAPRVVWNRSSSVPIGLYRVDRTSKIMVNDLVIVIPPEPLAVLLASRGYLPRGVPLIKRVLALAGQTVCREGLMISVDYDKIGMAQARDSMGRPLPEWQGCRVIKGGEIFLMNASVPDSLDGRYFGPLPVSSIIGIATPLAASDVPKY